MQILPPGKRSCWYRNRVMKVKGEMKLDLVELTVDPGL